MRLGILPRRLRVPDLLRQRLFVTRVGLPERWQKYYWGKIKTRLMPQGREHRLRYAA
jgi:hypothetical protein